MKPTKIEVLEANLEGVIERVEELLGRLDHRSTTIPAALRLVNYIQKIERPRYYLLGGPPELSGLRVRALNKIHEIIYTTQWGAMRARYEREEGGDYHYIGSRPNIEHRGD